jgi:hypothetical protein
MFNTLLFAMVAALFVHQFLNFFLTMVSTVANKITGSTTPVSVHSVEAFIANVLAGVFNWFKSL